MIEGVYLGRQTARLYSIRSRELIKWGDVGKVALAAALAAITLVGSFWTHYMGLFGVVAAGCCFMVVYVPLLLLLRLPEALLLQGSGAAHRGPGSGPAETPERVLT